MKIDISYGNGGRETSDLIRQYFLKYINNDILQKMEDAAVFEASGKLAFTTDSFVVKPLFFKGGDIGRLSVCGTINDLLSVGAVPKYISMGFIIEENFDTDDLEKILVSIRDTAAEAGVIVVTADTKVIEGNGGLMINTSGIGFCDKPFSVQHITEGDAILVSGNLGEHHASIMSERMGITNQIQSDVAPLGAIVDILREHNIAVHSMRDITRGGLATVLKEMAGGCGCRFEIEEDKLPVSKEVQGFCNILGLDPLYMANEGKFVAFVPAEQAEQAVALMKKTKYGANATIVGTVQNGANVLLRTRLGGQRQLDLLRGEGLPRIC